MMKQIGLTMLFVSVFFTTSFSQKDWMKVVEARERWASGKTFKWKVDYKISLNTKAIASEIAQIQRQIKNPINIKPEHYTVAELIIARQEEKAFLTYTILDSSRYEKGKTYSALLGKDFMAIYLTKQGEDPPHITIFPTKVPALFITIPPLAVNNDEIRGAHPAFVTCAPPHKVFAPLGMEYPLQNLHWQEVGHQHSEVVLKLSTKNSDPTLHGEIILSAENGYYPKKCFIS